MRQYNTRTPVFLSYPRPCMNGQQTFIDRIDDQLRSRGLGSRTLGVTDHDWDAPLKAIRHLMLASCGLIAIAFRRTYINQGIGNCRTDTGNSMTCLLNDEWLTSPWVHIESAMAYQIGLPILILREKGVMAEGLLENDVAGICIPAFDLGGALDCYFTSPVWGDLISRWEVQVKSIAESGRRLRCPSGTPLRLTRPPSASAPGKAWQEGPGRRGPLHGVGLFAITLAGDRICALTRFENSVLPWFGPPRSLPGR